jgi:hypothetical protein
MPVMAGFNFPAFKILDVLAVEGEYFGTIYPNDMERAITTGLPIPFKTGSVADTLNNRYGNGSVKWSIYGTKSIGRHYSITFLVASDHMRAFAVDWDRQDFEEILRKPDQWYWTVKFGVSF